MFKENQYYSAKELLAIVPFKLQKLMTILGRPEFSKLRSEKQGAYRRTEYRYCAALLNNLRPFAQMHAATYPNCRETILTKRNFELNILKNSYDL